MSVRPFPMATAVALEAMGWTRVGDSRFIMTHVTLTWTGAEYQVDHDLSVFGCAPGRISSPKLDIALGRVRNLVDDHWRAFGAWCVTADKLLGRGGNRCARGCGRARPTASKRLDGELAEFCDQCRTVAKRRCRLAGKDPQDERELLVELRRQPTRGPMPGPR